MLSRYSGTAVCIFRKHVQNNLPVILCPINYAQGRLPSVRYINKHWDPKWKKFRREKVIKVNVPDIYEIKKRQEKMSNDEIRTEQKKRGIVPARTWQETPIFISNSGFIADAYVPPEGDGKFSVVSTQGAKQQLETTKAKGKNIVALRRIKQHDTSFETKDFPHVALDIYKKAHEALANNKDDLRLYVTEKAIPEIEHNVKHKTIFWKFVESLEPPRIVRATVSEVVKGSLFGQITVRLHTQQILAIYDRFGRLMYGSEILKKDVLEYVVFERHLLHEYGVWRVHGKIMPPWMPSRDVCEKTYIQPPKEPEPPMAADVPPESAKVEEIKDQQPHV